MSDPLREPPLRLLGYANEVGEAFRPLVPASVVKGSYVVAFGYCLADTVDKSMKAQQKGKSTAGVAQVAADTLLWQTFASVAIPGFTINRICALSLFMLSRAKVPVQTARWATTAVGLGSIPLIFKPIDHFVDWAMDNTFRRVFPPTA